MRRRAADTSRCRRPHSAAQTGCPPPRGADTTPPAARSAARTGPGPARQPGPPLPCLLWRRDGARDGGEDVASDHARMREPWPRFEKVDVGRPRLPRRPSRRHVGWRIIGAVHAHGAKNGARPQRLAMRHRCRHRLFDVRCALTMLAAIETDSLVCELYTRDTSQRNL